MINLRRMLAGQRVGVREVSENIWLVSFMHHGLGVLNHASGRSECAPKPFAAKVLRISSVDIKRYRYIRN
jgi:hypothetical protein